MRRSQRGAIASLHGVPEHKVEVFEDDAALYEARRAARLRSEGRHRRAVRKPPLRQRWAAAGPIERLTWVIWWTICAVIGGGFGILAMLFVQFAILP